MMSSGWIIRVFVASAFGATFVVALQQNQLQSRVERSNQTLPTVDKVQVKEDSWAQLASLGAQLDKRLVEEQAKSKSAIVSQQAVYSHKVQEQRGMNEQAYTYNENIKYRIIALQTSNKGLRAEADSRVKACEDVRKYIYEVRGNVSLAKDFLDGAINESKDMLGKEVPELAVLRQLKAEEEHERREKQRQMPTADANIAMLQTAAGGNPQQVLQSMVESLEAVTKERNLSLASLKNKFAEDIEKLSLTNAVLLEEQAKLNSTLKLEMLRNAHLEESIGHLQKTYDQLQDQSKALRLFAQRLGINKKLTGKEQEDDENGATTAVKTTASVASRPTVKTPEPAMMLSKKKAQDLVTRAESNAKALSEMAKRDGTPKSNAAALKAEQALARARAVASKLGGI